jgi:hypothetical protein
LSAALTPPHANPFPSSRFRKLPLQKQEEVVAGLRQRALLAQRAGGAEGGEQGA